VVGVVLGVAVIVDGQSIGLAVQKRAPGVRRQLAARATPSEHAACTGLLSQSGRLQGVLGAVPRYASAYVLVVPQRHADKVPSPDAPEVKALQVGVQTGTPAEDAARALGLTNTKAYAFEPAIVKPLEDVKAGTLDAALLWAPIAGLGIIELGLVGEVLVFSVDRPRPAPASLRIPPADPGADPSDPCSDVIAEELELNGVLPAELLIPVDIRDLLPQRPPAFDLDAARAGRKFFNRACAKCHGRDAVADTERRAPVDLLFSVTRFSFAGFNYIVLNGRTDKSMPPLRGTVTDEQVAQIYQYLKARSRKLLPAHGE
jgi:mono/diheme cytochrome c family protein